jgi:hypothetical protein
MVCRPGNLSRARRISRERHGHELNSEEPHRVQDVLR